jgi:putative ATPase
VCVLATDARTADALRQQSAHLSTMSRPVILGGSLIDLPDLIAVEYQEAVHFDAIVGRNALTHHPDKVAAARVIATLLAPGGRLSLAEAVPCKAQRLYRLVDLSLLDDSLRQRLVAAEEAIYANPDDPMVNWDESDLQRTFQAAGVSGVHLESEDHTAQKRIGAEQLALWFATGETSPSGERLTYAQHLRQQLSAAEVAQVQALFERQLRDQVVAWIAHTVYVSARRE